jgi:hypothetical protein
MSKAKATISLKPRKVSSFLARYRLDRKVLVRANPGRGIPALRTGQDSEGNEVIIKVWPREEAIDDSALREIWRHETRQLQRLAGYPGVTDLIADLRLSAYDEAGYYLVIYPGQRRPLATFLQEDDRRKTRDIAARIRGWSNILRATRGLEILHLQGLLHRNLSAWSILTTNESEADFQLTGFEWSMRLVGASSQPKKKVDAEGEEGLHSFLRDWHDLGMLTIEYLDLPKSRLTNLGIPSYDVAEGFTSDEIRLVRELIQVFPSDRLDGRIVTDQIQQILTALTALQQAQSPTFHLVVPFGPNSPISDVIREAGDQEIEIYDVDAQEDFVRSDLISPTAMLVAKGGRREDARLLVRGERLFYYLDDLRRGRDRATPSNWDFAFCTSASRDAPPSSSVIRQITMPTQSISIMRAVDVQRTLRFRKTSSWKSILQRLALEAELPREERLLLKSFVLMQMLDYLFAASDLFPVSVEEKGTASDEEEDRYRIRVRPRKEQERDELSKALGIKDPPAKRLADALTGDRYGGERPNTWTLTTSAVIGDRAEETSEWQFEAVEKEPSGELTYVFSGERPAIKAPRLYLMPADSSGTDYQLRRRMKSFAALAEHRNLLRTLINPRARVLDSHETPLEDSGFRKLDASKQAAFKSIIETLPIFLVQGPPGVGKTRMVHELVRQALAGDKATRILLSAQSNYAVDHLLHQVTSAASLSGRGDVLVIRSAPRDKKDEESDFDITAQTKNLIKALAQSQMAKKASENLRERLGQLLNSYGLPGKADDGFAPSSAKRAVEALVLRAANLVFATTNSGELERLIDERSQFDWTIVEESGKATGAELVSPLLLSPRRLLIGDHKQLPPFGEERALNLLTSPESVKTALKLGNPMIGRSLRDATVNEIFGLAAVETVEDEEDEFAELCAETTRNFTLFETLIEQEFERQARSHAGRPIGAQLNEQHRMHPIISDWVSHAFYKGALKTHEDTKSDYAKRGLAIISADTARLPDQPIVWVDMPWVQTTANLKIGERFPRFWNAAELSALDDVLSLLRPAHGLGRRPSLSVLSPYARQVKEMAAVVERGFSGRLKHLKKFANESRAEYFCNTVDSFQGNEADFVIVSLVRNNSHGSIHTALGFLADARRVNVLLSRAKSRLIVIGCLQFLRAVNNLAMGDVDRNRIEFLGLLLDFLDKPRDGLTIVPASSIAGGGK